jgi:hypothetical protein
MQKVHSRLMLDVALRGPATQILHCLMQEGRDLLAARQLHLVARHKELVAHVSQGVLHQFLILASTQQDADGRLIALGHLVPFVVADVGVELAQVLVLKGVSLQLDEHMALEHAVVENQVHKEVFAAYDQALLPCLEAKAMAQLQQKACSLSSRASSSWPSVTTSFDLRPRNSKM